MDLPWLAIGLSSVAGSLILVHNAPQYSISASYIKTFLALETIQLLLGLLWRVVLYPKLFSPLRHLPHPKGGSFFNGQFKRIIKEPTGDPHRDWINNIPNEGLIYYTTYLNQERLFITSPQALSESYDCIKPQLLRNGLGRVLGIGLVLAEGDEHKRQRKNLTPAFTYRHVKDLYPVFWAKSSRLVNELMSIATREGEESTKSIDDAPIVDSSGWSSRATLDIIGSAGMGVEFNAIENPDTKLNATYRKVLAPNPQGQKMALLGLLLPRWFLRALPVRHNTDIMASTKTIKEVCRDIIRKTKDHKEKRVNKDIISVALESGSFTDEELVNQMMTFLAAGHETTAASMTWAFYLLCQHPETQTRLRKEIRANLPPIDSTDAITAASLDQCHYLHAVCNEILRLYPPVPYTMREAGRDTSIVGHPVPKGTTIVLVPWAVNTATALWGADADRFNPDRWIAGPGQATNNTGGAESNYAFMTFLHGPRGCIGQAFARAEFACLLAAVVGRFEIKSAEGEGVKLAIRSGITAKPAGGVPVRIKPVERW